MRQGAAAVSVMAVLGAATAAGAAESRAALISALSEHACRLAPDQVAPVLAPQGFTPDFVRKVFAGMIVDGTASEDAAGRLSLPADLCPPDSPVPTPRQQFLERFRAAGDCTLEASDLPKIERELELGEPQLRAIAEPLYEAGTLTVERGAATLGPALCATDEEG